MKKITNSPQKGGIRNEKIIKTYTQCFEYMNGNLNINTGIKCAREKLNRNNEIRRGKKGDENMKRKMANRSCK